MRPWVNTIVSVAQLRTTRELRIINCTLDNHRNVIYFQEPDVSERYGKVWQTIDNAFARPITVDDGTADYVPTQVLAENFREHGFDGVGYRNSLGPGHNIVLFDLESADIINCSLLTIRSLKLEYQQAGNPYFVANVDDAITRECPSMHPLRLDTE